jgi:hypothetical protein
MLIKRKSELSGLERTKDIPIDPENYIEWQRGYASIDEAMPYLTSEDREFILSGMTPTEWKAAFSKEIMSIVSDTFA